jgi:uncharacterized protein with HEPN domain
MRQGELSIPKMIKKRLLDTLIACQAIHQFTAGLDLPAYEESLLIRSAVERQFEIVGEALNRASELDADLAKAIPELRRIIGLRNRLIHGYDAVDDEIVWDVVQTKLPILESQIHNVLDRYE